MRPRARDGWLLLGLWVIFTLLGELLVALLIGGYPEAAAREGAVSDEAIFYLLRWTVPIAVAVILVLVYASLRFRSKDEDGSDAAAQPRNNLWVGGLWVLVSLVIVLGFVRFPGISGLREIWASQAAENPLAVTVVARQWEWSFSYPQLGIEDVGELVLPVGRTVRFDITSEDVIHSFWIPSLRIKKDAIPGETRTLYLTPSRLTSTKEDPMTRVQCAELCGVGHARMRASARVVSPDDFQTWVAQQGGTQTMDTGDTGMPGMGGE